jgi:hypothetical protein
VAKQLLQPFQDEVLGVMPWDEDEGGWVGRTAGGAFRIVVAGGHQPHPSLLAAARALSANPSNFIAQVASHLRAFADRVPDAASEVLGLQIEALYLTRPDRPDDGMIYFTGPDPYRVWRCDYVAGVPRDLGFDD